MREPTERLILFAHPHQHQMKKLNEIILSITVVPVLVVLLRLIIPAGILIVAVLLWPVTIGALVLCCIVRLCKGKSH